MISGSTHAEKDSPATAKPVAVGGCAWTTAWTSGRSLVNAQVHRHFGRAPAALRDGADRRARARRGPPPSRPPSTSLPGSRAHGRRGALPTRYRLVPRSSPVVQASADLDDLPARRQRPVHAATPSPDGRSCRRQWYTSHALGGCSPHTGCSAPSRRTSRGRRSIPAWVENRDVRRRSRAATTHRGG